MSTPTAGRPTRDELVELVEEGDIDTIIVAIVDMQGRVQGKRLDATYFFDELADGVVEGCSYLLASDVDMRTVDGFALTSWERGYGDLAFKPDFSSTRLVPWHEKTVIIFADVETVDGVPVAPSPRQILLAQVARLAERGWTGITGHRTGVHRLRGHLRAGLGRRLPRHDAGEPVQRRLLDPGHLADRTAARTHSSFDARRPV